MLFWQVSYQRLPTTAARYTVLSSLHINSVLNACYNGTDGLAVYYVSHPVDFLESEPVWSFGITNTDH